MRTTCAATTPASWGQTRERSSSNRAAAAAIAEQRALGLDEWTGGEYFTDNFIDHMQRVLHGVEIDKPRRARPLRLSTEIAHCKIRGRSARPRGPRLRTRLRAREQAARRRAQGNRRGPARDRHPRPGSAGRAPAPDAEPDRDRQPGDARARGCGLSARPARRPRVRRAHQHGADDAPAGRRGRHRVLRRRQGVTRGMHICNGNFKGRPLSAVVPTRPGSTMLQELEGVVDVAALECNYFAEWAERDAFRRDAPEHAARGRHRRRGQLRDRGGQENPRTSRGLGTRGRRGPAVDLAVMRLRAPPGPHTAPPARKLEHMVEAASFF